ncbi:TonB-dependent receptor plug domain-containing protein [Falsiroseomonas bella]|nr:TonB-dependent receptor [Falsiroseomonas bella]
MRSIFLVTCAGALALAPSAWAQPAPQIQAPETVVTATRIPTPQDRVPAAVTVITRQDIEERGYRTLAEALRTVPGMRLVQAGGVGQQASGFLRGSASRHVLVLLDGVPINDPSEPNGAYNFGNELLGDIQRIEVVRGPASALYGSGAIGGVVNMITRRAPANTPFQAFGEVAGGTQRTLGGNGGVAGTTERYDYLFMGQGLSTRASDATAPRFWSNTGEREGFSGGAATARVGVRPTPTTRIEGLLRWRENQFGLDNVPNDDPNNEIEDRRWFGQVRGEAVLFGIWTTGLRAAVTDDRRRNVNLPDSLSPTRTDDIFRGTRETYDWGNRLDFGTVGAARDVRMTFGITREIESSDSTAGSLPFQTVTDATARSTAYHVGGQARFLDRLEIFGGVRQDEAEGYGGFTAWRLGATLDVPEVNSRLLLSAGTAFKAPSLFQRFGTIGTFFQGNPDLRPEESFAWEAGIESDLPAFGRDDFATLGATFFQTRFRDLINFNAAFSSLENVEDARAQGVELSATLRPAAWLELTANWTITETRDDATGAPLARRPRNAVAGLARIAPGGGVVIVPELIWTGRSPEGPFASYNDDGSSVTTIAYNKPGAVLNLTASWQATEAIALYAEGRNLTNSRFEPANGFVIAGRSLVVGTRFVF